MSEFSNCQPSTYTLTLILHLLSNIPFGKAEPADDDLFPPIRPPADATPPQADDAEEGGDDVDMDAQTGDGSDASEESEEVSPSVVL